ncbi:cytochrome c oxidase accessory protein CcoG [Poseidonibacter ostreae]|uniref:Cytochrome c oxidase accessory protein CcoG n=1 Tax=Poseidonibacter ostreae TaxID=2654171 RepID=A0A6L4WTE4_9BACT|nr:cytochrome c oxidase accessory protein CcoG [Poseidonibacter ostreae]KAB7885234.1 cytochrome c oxidase accessory protein CcoG [Poseidonibacter ostreae]KAB7889308.1 cytochrome c oxidase accessory protein CcoG [Poseidonibacter ostreae]KAB7892153.1 cytochrome c oxidase accessory protein CcoG [Poseidonibacter ostreae]MAC83535.1 cytochrome c oxidase accessory protein CcoG [Arcobacter sp.]
MSYTKKRYLVYIFITIFTFTMPFITIDNNHILLLSFDKLQFHFFGFVYNVNELYVMPFLLMFLFIGIFAMTTLFGRVWCGWACPQTIFRVIYRDLIESTILDIRRIKNKQKELDYSKKSIHLKKYISIFLWLIITIVISTNFMWYFVPPEDFFLYIQNPSEHMFMIIFMLSVALFLVYDIVFMKENFCVYICPYSRVQSVLYDDDTKQIVYDTSRGGDVYVNAEKSIFKMKEWNSNEECTTCEACVKICPANIDIRKGLQVECINCLECADACDIVMGKLGKKSLINWGSTNSVINKKTTKLLTKRNISYFVSLILCIILAIVFASKKEPFLLNINKTTNLYKIKEEQKVTNNYILTFHNTQDKTYTFDIKLEDNENFAIKRFKAFKLEPNKRVKKIFIVETKKRLFISKTQNSALKIKINSFALENENISLSRELSFIYPRSDLIK